MEQTLFTEPTNGLIPTVIGLAKMARLSFEWVDMTPLWQQLTARFAENDTEPAAVLNMCAALMDMCLIDQILDNAERGLSLQAQALKACRLYQMPVDTKSAPIKLLGFATAGKIMANTPVEFLIEDSDVTLYLLYVVPGMPLPPVPDHDLALVLAADSEEAQPVLQEIERLAADWPRPVLNRPSRIPQTGRERLYKVLAPLAGVVIPATIRVGRAVWESIGRGERGIESVLPDGGFPLIVRPLDSHAGFGLEKIENAAEVAPYLSRHPDSEFHISRFMDYRSTEDGLYRKYRITIIDGEAFPCHMGVSDHWMIHFVNAGMMESVQKRAEEERFMAGFPREFGHRHGRAFAEMADVLGLDYFGIDCSETPDGKLLVFEAGTALVVHNMDPPDIFPYKGPHMRAVFHAFRALLSRNCRKTA